jgi:hypothetical protein
LSACTAWVQRYAWAVPLAVPLAVSLAVTFFGALLGADPYLLSSAEGAQLSTHGAWFDPYGAAGPACSCFGCSLGYDLSADSAAGSLFVVAVLVGLPAYLAVADLFGWARFFGWFGFGCFSLGFSAGSAGCLSGWEAVCSAPHEFSAFGAEYVWVAGHVSQAIRVGRCRWWGRIG